MKIADYSISVPTLWTEIQDWTTHTHLVRFTVQLYQNIKGLWLDEMESRFSVVNLKLETFLLTLVVIGGK